MKTRLYKGQKLPAAEAAVQKKDRSRPSFQLADKRPAMAKNQQLRAMMNNGSRVKQLTAIKEMTANKPKAKQVAQPQAPAGQHSQQNMAQLMATGEEAPLQAKFEDVQQLEKTDEEEAPLQGKFEDVQRLEKTDEEEAPLQGKFEDVQQLEKIDEEEAPLQGKFETAQRSPEAPGQLPKSQTAANNTTQLQENRTDTTEPANRTGMPDKLKTGIENLSGLAMDDVKVHYNSDKPTQLNAHAYAQGTEIHLAQGQEKHLPHEAWHVVQQKQGRVKPTMQLKDKVKINDDKELEKDADVMGEKAWASGFDSSESEHPWSGYRNKISKDNPPDVVQRGKNTDDEQEELGKRKSPSDDDFGSELARSDDDSETDYNFSQQFKRFLDMGKRKLVKLTSLSDHSFDVINEGNKDDGKANRTITNLTNKRDFQIYSHQRVKGTNPTNDINEKAYVKVAGQNLSINAGKGLYIQPGGNTTRRPADVKEPFDRYDELIPAMMNLGRDKNVKTLYNKARPDEKYNARDKISETDLASILLYIFKLEDIEAVLGNMESSQLVEDIGKLYTIVNIAEFGRGIDSEDGPYDATLFFKAGLAKVANGESTFKEMFYQGKNKKDSIFMGAAQGNKDEGIDGGAKKLRNPVDYPGDLERQMKIFPTNKKEFKKFVNDLRTTDTGTFVYKKLSMEEKEAITRQKYQEFINTINELAGSIDNIAFANAEEAYEWSEKKQGFGYKALAQKVKKLVERGDTDSVELRELQNSLNQKLEEAYELIKANKPRGSRKRAANPRYKV